MPVKSKSRVRGLREKAGFTQAQLAVFVGVSPNTIQSWEKDAGVDQLRKYAKLCEILGCQISDLIEEVKVPEDDEESKSKGFSISELKKLRNSFQ